MAKKKRKKRRPRPNPNRPVAAVAPVPRAKRSDGPPTAPWGTFPLSEIVVLVGIVLLIGGFFIEPPRGPVMIGAGLVLGSLAGLELSAREHFAGYRSHTLLLAGTAGVAVLAGLLALTKLNPGICAGAAVAVFGLCAWLLASAFRKRSGGALFRFGAGR